MKSSIVVLTLLIVMVLPAACKKKEEPAQKTPPPGHGIVIPKGQTKIVVPDFVKDKWKAVRLEILNKSTNKKEEVTINLKSEYNIPDSNLKVKVGDFLPDFRMDGLTITSASNEPKNPAVYVVVSEGENEIFKGWLYSKFPSIHPFQHEIYTLTLLGGIKSP